MSAINLQPNPTSSSLFLEDDTSLDEKITILLVDDRETNLFALESILTSAQYRLVKKQSGAEALRYLLNHEPALILMDVQMPEMDGFETVSIIKQNTKTRDIPIIFVTALNVDERYVQEGYSHGAVDYIQKPYDPYILRSKVSVFAELASKTRRLVRAEKQLRIIEKKDRERRIAQLEIRHLKREQNDQKRYLDLVEGINQGIVWSADPDSLSISFVSRSAEKILGFPIEQWSNEEKFFLNHTHSHDRKKVREAISLSKESGLDSSVEHRFLTSKNREIWLHTRMKVMPKEDGIGNEIRALSMDITKIKEAERVLLFDKRRADFLAEASVLLSETLDFETTLANVARLAVPKFCDCFSIHIVDTDNTIKLHSVTHFESEKTAVVKDFLERFPMEKRPDSGVMKVLQTNQSQIYSDISIKELKKYSLNKTHYAALENVHPKSAMFIPLQARNRTLGVMSFVVTESQYTYSQSDLSMAEDLARRAALAIDNAQFYQQAQAAIHARDEFLSVASHELKTPITPLKLQTQILMKMLKDKNFNQLNEERIDKMLQISDRQLERLSRLVEDLLDISRITNGKLNLNPEKFDFIELLNEVVERFNRELESAKCRVNITAPSSLWVEWDHCRIEQVVINILTNAVKYGEGKPIDIEVAENEGYAYISFKDHGIGIAPKDQSRIFNRFERAVSNSHISGLGLGLYIVTQVLSAHFGDISVDSTLGKGSTFKLSLPLQIPNSTLPQEPHVTSTEIPVQKTIEKSPSRKMI